MDLSDTALQKINDDIRTHKKLVTQYKHEAFCCSVLLALIILVSIVGFVSELCG